MTKNKTLYKTSKLLIFCFTLAIFNSCTGQTKNADSCNLHYKNARNKLNNYYKSNDESLLREALKEAEQSLKCPNNVMAVELKLSLLSLLKDYKGGSEYIKGLTEADFKYAYKKDMNYYYYLSMEYSSKSDTLNRNKFLSKAVQSIQSYLDKENMPNNKLDEEAYYDLFFIKRMFLSKQRIDIEIDKVKKKYPNNSEFFEVLKNSIEEDAKTVKPMD